MTRQTTSITDPPSAVLWADGELYPDASRPEAVPDELALLLGVELGLSPITHVQQGRWVGAHLRVLGAAAGLLGYEGFDATTVRSRLESLPAGTWLVSLVPGPASHRALPPGSEWTVEVEPFEPPRLAGRAVAGPEVEGESDGVVAGGGWRVATGAFRRNQTLAATSLLLRDDTEWTAGAATGSDVDATLWLDLDGHVATIDRHCVIARVGGRLVTPALDHGALRTAPRHVLVTGDGGPTRDVVVESTLTPADLVGAEAIVCLTPWGSAIPVTELDRRPLAPAPAHELADTITSRLEEAHR